MSVTLSQVLELIGRLDDDSPGFDAPRERFRRFLTDGDLPTARALIEEGQHLVGEQEHRALTDAVVALGRFLGFESFFGAYERRTAAAKHGGHWRSRRRLHIVTDVRSNSTPKADLDDLSRLRAAVTTDTALGIDAPLVGLCIVTPLFAARARLEEALNGDQGRGWRLVSVRSLLWLAEMVSTARLKHEEIVKLVTSGVNLDFVVELLERFSEPAANRTGSDATGPIQVESTSMFWAATIERGEAATFQKMVESAVRDRHVLGVTQHGTSSGDARPDDWICFFAPGKGVIGKAQVSAADADAQLLRRSDRFSRLYGLKNVELYATPIAPPSDLEHALIAAHERAAIPGPLLVPVTAKQFSHLNHKDQGNHKDHVDHENHKDHKDHEDHKDHKDHKEVIERASRSRG